MNTGAGPHKWTDSACPQSSSEACGPRGQLSEHAQEQRHPIQEDQEQEVGAAQQGPVGDTGTDREPHP